MKKILFIISVLFSSSLFAQWSTVAIGTTQDLYAVDYFSSNDIWIGSFQQIVKSSTGGSSWSTINPIKDNLGININPANMYDLALTSPTNAIGTGFYFLGNTECILNTTNGGVNWNFASTNSTVGLPRYINSVDVSGTRAIAVGNNGRIARSTNSGVSWTFVSSGVSSFVSDVKFGTYDTVYAAGDNKVFRSVDGGSTWTNQTISGSFKSIGCDRGVVYLGGFGVIYKSINYGVTYTPIVTPFSYQGTLYAIDKDTILAAGNDGIYVSRTGGAYWEKYILPSYQLVKMFDFLNSNVGMAVGNVGYALKTNNLSIAPRVPLSNYSIVGGGTSFCVGDNISFTNSTIPGCTYQWQLDGINFSTSYSPPSLTLSTVGTHTISLISTNGFGSNTMDIVVTITGHNVVNPFTFSTSFDTICNGYNITFTLPAAESGVMYQLRRNYVNIGGPQFGSGSTLTFTSGATSGTNSFSIKGSKTNSCFVDSVVNFKTIYSATALTSTLFYVSRDTVCYGDTASLIIPNSVVGYKYTWYNATLLTTGTTFINGTGSTIVIPLSARTGDHSFAPKAIHISKGCSSIFIPAKLIRANKPATYFTMNNFNPEIGETIYSINNSINPTGTCQWSFGVGASIPFSSAITPLPITYSSTGQRTIKLVNTTAFGCKDSLMKNLNVIAPFTNDTCSFTQAASVINGGSLTAIQHDYQGNLFYWYDGENTNKFVAYSNHGDSIVSNLNPIPNYDYSYFLTKYNPKGVPMWTTKLWHGSTWTKNGEVETDTAGNVYCTYFHNEHTDSLRIYSSDNSYVTINPTHTATLKSVVVIKYNKDGIFQWYNTFFETYAMERLGMRLDRFGDVYVCSDRMLNKFSNSNGALLWSKNGTYSDVEVDNLDNVWVSDNAPFNRDIMVQKYDPAGNLLFTSPPITQLGCTIAAGYLELDNQNNIYLAGVFSGKFIYNNDTINDPYAFGPVHEDVFLCKMKPTGQQEWIKQFKNYAASTIKGLVVKNNDVVLFVTTYNDSVVVSNLPAVDFISTGHYIYHTDSLGGSESINKLYETSQPYITGSGGGICFKRDSSSDLSLGFEFNSNFNYSGSTVVPYGTFTSIHNSVVESGSINCLLPNIPTTNVPDSYFLSSVTSICIGQSVTFNDLSSNSPTSWSWTFAGGSPATSTLQNPTVVFNTPGLHSVTLVASNGFGAGTLQTNNVLILAPPTINITADSVVCEGGYSYFDISVTPASVLGYQWQDSTALHTWANISGQTSLNYYPTGTMAENGNKYRCAVSVACGTYMSRSIPFTVLPIPLATISPSTAQYFCSGDSLLLSANTGSGYTYVWEYNYSLIPGATNFEYSAFQDGYYVVGVTNSFGCSASSADVQLIMQNDCDVWPGDANNDYVANNLDILTLGLYYSQVGLARTIVSNSWIAYPSTDWGTIQIDGWSDIKNADCNGDGLIDSNDTLAINLNYSSVHTLLPPIIDVRSSTPLMYFTSAQSVYAPGDWVNINLWAGTSAVKVNNLYGIAFSMYYDSYLAQIGTENLNYPNSWLGSTSTNAITIEKIDPPFYVYGAMSRTNHTNADGYGHFATLSFQLDPTISTYTTMAFSIDNYAANDSVGYPVSFGTLPYYSIDIDPALIITGISALENSNVFNVYPNPYHDNTTIYYELKENSKVSVEIFNTIGQKMETIFDGSQLAGEYKYSFSAKEKGYDAGIYFVKFTIDGKTTMKKIIEVK